MAAPVGNGFGIGCRSGGHWPIQIETDRRWATVMDLPVMSLVIAEPCMQVRACVPPVWASLCLPLINTIKGTTMALDRFDDAVAHQAAARSMSGAKSKGPVWHAPVLPSTASLLAPRASPAKQRAGLSARMERIGLKPLYCTDILRISSCACLTTRPS